MLDSTAVKGETVRLAVYQIKVGVHLWEIQSMCSLVGGTRWNRIADTPSQSYECFGQKAWIMSASTRTTGLEQLMSTLPYKEDKEQGALMPVCGEP